MKILFSILIYFPFALLAQDNNKQTFKYASIAPQQIEDINKEFRENYKKGMAAYNAAVDAINKMEPASDVVTIDKMQEEAKEHFKSAMPFFEKAYSINSKNEKLLIALQGVYFGLSDFEKSDRYKNELESLKKIK